ncbi:MAG: hypothetical protein D4R79_01435 [Comamonadaceae bacterium]|nr:MAG: hypothetical protein D4R79_01435 [Comamonadaceae bacterium]
MNLLKYSCALLILGVLAACGGGGGNPGTSSGGTVTCTAPKVLQNGVCVTATVTVTPVETLLVAQLKDMTSGAVVASIGAASATEIVGLLATKDGKPAPNQLVSLDTGTGSSLLLFPNGTSATTDANGIARIRVGRTNLFEFGTTALSLTFKSTDTYAQASSSVLQIRVDPPLLQLELRDAANAVTNTIGSSGLTTLKAILKFSDGTPVSQKRIDITADLTKITFPEGSSQLTDSLGVATVKVTRASATVGGAGTLAGAASISGSNAAGAPVTTVVTGGVDYSVGAVVGAATLTLDTFDVGAASLAAYGTRQISVRAMLGTSVASSVQVSFSSSCGQLSPATAPTNSSGIATASFTATDIAGTTVSTLGCGGKTVDISVSAVGASTVSKSVSVLAAPATNLSFVVPTDASKSRIYLANSGGATQAMVQFLLSNARGEALPGQEVLVSLKTLNGGTPKATFGTVGNVAPVSLTTDSLGKVSVPVFSGTVPTNVLVNAALVSNLSIKTDSSVVVIASGRPVQSRVSLVPAKHAIRGFNFDGATTTVTMSLADRQGNPVPDGTAVNFVSEAGVMIPPTCVTGAVPGDSQCTVTIRTQNPRPFAADATKNGYVSILAYTAGEEDFTDTNFSNTYDGGDSFSLIGNDLGTAYRDDLATANVTPGAFKLNADGTTSLIPSWDGTMYVHQPGEFAIPRAAEAGGTTPLPNQGDGVWGAADVRGQVVIVFSTDDLLINNPVWTGAGDAQWNNGFVATGLTVIIQDLNGRSVPTGSSISVVVTDNTPKLPTDGAATPIYGTCSLVSQSHSAVPDSLEPLTLTLSLKQCASGDQVAITVTTPAGVKTYAFPTP